jgi:exopolysaccharide biosynthesis polyprenyl glycosylphosphotransferase
MDTLDVMASLATVLCDALAVFGGFLLATKIRFDSGLIPVPKGRPEDLWSLYVPGAAVATVIFLFIFKALDMYLRPQTGSFTNKIPRIIKGTAVGLLFAAAMGFAIKTRPPFSAGVVVVAFGTVFFLVTLERYILYRIEWNLARHSPNFNKVLILGTNETAAHVKRTLEREVMLRSKIAGFLKTDPAHVSDEVPQDRILGTSQQLSSVVRENDIDQLIVTDPDMGHERLVEIMVFCEKNMLSFNVVPDLFSILAFSTDVQTLDDIPLLGIGRWPLDNFWNRVLKRIEDIGGSFLGLLVAAPIIAVAAVLIKCSSRGSVFYVQDRCGRSGETFRLYKLRTMKQDAEHETGPVWATEDDSRRTRVGAFLRKYNLDELPQLWNVFRGDMSLVGPRPERPHFVEKFREDIVTYMRRHVTKPGMTGWAQINGLRGNTSIEERVKYDLYYLEKWSLAFDLKILLKTLFANKNAY